MGREKLIDGSKYPLPPFEKGIHFLAIEEGSERIMEVLLAQPGDRQTRAVVHEYIYVDDPDVHHFGKEAGRAVIGCGRGCLLVSRLRIGRYRPESQDKRHQGGKKQAQGEPAGDSCLNLHGGLSN